MDFFTVDKQQLAPPLWKRVLGLECAPAPRAALLVVCSYSHRRFVAGLAYRIS